MVKGGSDPPAGLCATCRHVRIVGNRRGSYFYLCERSRTDPDYPRYPRIPVRSCPGYEADEDRLEIPGADE